MTRPEVLQLAVSVHPPFFDLCCAHARALGRAGARVITVFLEGAADVIVPDDLDVRFLRRSKVGSDYRGNARSLLAELGDRPIDRILCHRYKSYRVALALRQHLGRRIPVIAVAHGFDFLARRQRRWHQRWFARDVQFAGVSGAVTDDLAQYYHGPLEPRCLVNLIDTDLADARRLPRAEAREQLGLDAAPWVIGWIGRLHRKKDPLLAVDAFAQARPALPTGTRLVMIGSGELAASLSRRIAEHGLTDVVTLTGAVPDAARLMPAFDLLLFSAGAREAFGMVLLEAMLAGRLILSVDAPGPKSVLEQHGLYYAAGERDALARVLVRASQLSRADVEQLERGARERATAVFSVATAAARYRDMLGTSE
jgi:glycosyltransferase involved in cell wall biosynthesis